jgi:hypothetical protein
MCAMGNLTNAEWSVKTEYTGHGFLAHTTLAVNTLGRETDSAVSARDRARQDAGEARLPGVRYMTQSRPSSVGALLSVRHP